MSPGVELQPGAGPHSLADAYSFIPFPKHWKSPERALNPMARFTPQLGRTYTPQSAQPQEVKNSPGHGHLECN